MKYSSKNYTEHTTKLNHYGTPGLTWQERNRRGVPLDNFGSLSTNASDVFNRGNGLIIRECVYYGNGLPRRCVHYLPTHVCKLGDGVGFYREVLLLQLLLDLRHALGDVLRLRKKWRPPRQHRSLYKILLSLELRRFLTPSKQARD